MKITMLLILVAAFAFGQSAAVISGFDGPKDNNRLLPSGTLTSTRPVTGATDPIPLFAQGTVSSSPRTAYTSSAQDANLVREYGEGRKTAVASDTSEGIASSHTHETSSGVVDDRKSCRSECFLGKPCYPEEPWNCYPGCLFLAVRPQPGCSVNTPCNPEQPQNCYPGCLYLRAERSGDDERNLARECSSSKTCSSEQPQNCYPWCLYRRNPCGGGLRPASSSR
jgi:hypothetical protein